MNLLTSRELLEFLPETFKALPEEVLEHVTIFVPPLYTRSVEIFLAGPEVQTQWWICSYLYNLHSYSLNEDETEVTVSNVWLSETKVLSTYKSVFAAYPVDRWWDPHIGSTYWGNAIVWKYVSRTPTEWNI